MRNTEHTHYRITPQSLWLIILLFVVFVWLIWSLINTIKNTEHIRNSIQDITLENRNLEEKIAFEEAKIQHLSTTERITKEAKMQLGRKETGEEVIVFLEEDELITPLNTEQIIYERTTNTPYFEAGTPNYKKWKRYFFGKM